MLSIAANDKENTVKAHCQGWLKLLSSNAYFEAEKLINSVNSYGETWKINQIEEAVKDYFNDNSDVSFHYEDIVNCYPEFLETENGALLFGFYLPANGEITDLTVEFEFTSLGNSKYAACINNVHVL